MFYVGFIVFPPLKLSQVSAFHVKSSDHSRWQCVDDPWYGFCLLNLHQNVIIDAKVQIKYINIVLCFLKVILNVGFWPLITSRSLNGAPLSALPQLKTSAARTTHSPWHRTSQIRRTSIRSTSASLFNRITRRTIRFTEQPRNTHLCRVSFVHWLYGFDTKLQNNVKKQYTSSLKCSQTGRTDTQSSRERARILMKQETWRPTWH